MAKIEIYTKSTCGYCHAAKRLLTQKGASYNETDVGRDSGAKATMIQRSNGGRTVPQIFIDGKHVGGYDDLNALERAGKLNVLLS
jgi:glutaredoxin 3